MLGNWALKLFSRGQAERKFWVYGTAADSPDGKILGILTVGIFKGQGLKEENLLSIPDRV
jgi:hypothetical protein